jgi:hypothetical protein
MTDELAEFKKEVSIWNKNNPDFVKRKMTSLKGHAGKALKNNRVRDYEMYIAKYNIIADAYKLPRYGKPVKNVIAGYAPELKETPKSTRKKLPEPEDNIVVVNKKKATGSSQKKKSSVSKKPTAKKNEKGKNMIPVGTVPQVIKRQAIRGRTAVKKSQLTEDILKYELKKTGKREEQISKEIKTLKKEKARLLNK